MMMRVIGLLVVSLFGAATAWAAPLNVTATLPDLGSLAESVGGDEVKVTVFAKGTEDAHYVEARPSFIKRLADADVYLQAGMELESGWVPVLLENARNGRVLPGTPGFIDASQVIAPLEVPTGSAVTRAMGDVHPFGNPHYLQDPLEALAVAGLIRDRLIALRPDKRGYFEQRYQRFARQLAEALVGAALVQRYGVEDSLKLARLHRHGKLKAFLDARGETEQLAGWLGALLPYYGVKAVDDHNMWPYFARAFGIDIIGHLEPKPGIPPTTRHLKELIERMRAESVPIILAAAYYDPRHARFVAESTGAAVLSMAHLAGARPGTDDYLKMIDYNIRRLSEALSARS